MSAQTSARPSLANVDRSQRLSIQAIYKDKTLSAQEKHKRMQALMKGEAPPEEGQTKPPAATTPAASIQPPKSPGRVSLVDSGKEPSDLLISSVRKSSQPTIMEESSDEEDGDFKPFADETKPSSSGMMDINERNRAIKAVYMDNTLNGHEKQRRIQAIMKGEPLTVPDENPASDDDQKVAAVDNRIPPPASVTPPIKGGLKDPPPSSKPPPPGPKPPPPSAVPAPAAPPKAPPSPVAKPPPRSPPPTPPKGKAAISHRKEIMEVYNDSSMTALAKQKRVKEIIQSAPEDQGSDESEAEQETVEAKDEKPVGTAAAAAAVAGAAVVAGGVAAATATSTTSSNKPATQRFNPAANRRSMIIAVNKDASLTPKQKQEKIQAIMKTGNVVGNARGPDLQPESAALEAAIKESETLSSPTPKSPPPTAAPQPAAAPAPPPSPRPVANEAAAERRKAIVAVQKDKSLTPAEKQKRIQAIMKGGAVAGNASGVADVVPTEPPTPQSPPPVPVNPRTRTSLTNANRERSVRMIPIQNVDAEGGDSNRAGAAPAAAPSTTASSAEDAASAQRKAIQKIYKDKTLTPQEKHRRVQALTKNGTAASNAPASEAAETTSVGAAIAAGTQRGGSEAADNKSGSDQSSDGGESNFSDERQSRSSGSRSSRSDSRGSGSRSRSRSGSSRSRSYSSGSRSESSYSSRSGSYSSRSGSYSSRSGSYSTGSSFSGSGESNFSDEASERREMLIDADVAVAKPEDMRLFPTAIPGRGNKPPGGFVDEDSDSEYEDRGDPKRRLLCCILITCIILVATAAPLLVTYWDEVSLWFDELISGTKAPAPVPETSSPTAAPIVPTPPQVPPATTPSFAPTDFLYDRNTPEQCATIAQGGDIAGQESLEKKSFDVLLDVSLTIQLSDREDLVEALEEDMQRVLGPLLADCPANRRLTSSSPYIRGIGQRRELIEKNLIANAFMAAQLQADQPCTDTVTDPCLRVLTVVELFLKGPELNSPLVLHISDVFGGNLNAKLGISAPFKVTEVVGVSASPQTAPPDTPAPTTAPVETPAPTKGDTLAPTKAPTATPSKLPTQVPSQVPTTPVGREEDVETALKALGDIDDLVDDAVEWLIEDSEWEPENWKPPTPYIWQQRYAMAVLYFENDGSSWSDDDSWLDEDLSICEWEGVSCNEEGDIVQLELNDNDVDGEIPTEIGLLTSLTHLNMANNELDGTLPTEIGLLTNLKLLNLIDTDLSGTIPTEVGNMTTLETLILDDNDLEGDIPTEIGLLQNLSKISLFENQLTGSLPIELSQCTSLKEIRFSDNEIGGYLPSELFQLSLLEILQLDINEIRGTIPREIGSLTKLTHLEMDSNRLVGDVPRLPPNLVYGICDLDDNDFDDEFYADRLGCDV